ncbi:MAG TPA: nucleotide exchange factor GrpE [Egibacteraceae bacterium]|nr:nucleotide exchange factor GrpE [Egibacteraceae bacterium]
MTEPQEIRQDEAAEQAASPEPAPEDAAGDAEEATVDTEGAPAEATPPDDGRTRDELLAALAEAETQRDEYVDYLRRERAEFENYRKRSARERLETLDRGAEQIVSGLLGVLDNFSLALEAAEASDDDALAKGVQMVHNELLAALTHAGLDEIPGRGVPFDPEHHEAMMQVDATEELGREVDEPVVAEVLRRGYRFKGRVLRPASVKVAR